MAKRDAILDATKSLLWRVGYESMSPGRIMAESGAGQGSLYHHFKGKRDLAATALLEVEEELRDGFDAAMRREASPLDCLIHYLERPRAGEKGCRLGRLANEASIEDDALRAPVARFFEHVRQGLAEKLRDAVATGELRPDLDPDRLATTLLAIVQGGFVLSRVARDPAPLAEAAAGAVDLLRAARA